LESRVIRSQKLMGSQVDNELVMIDLESGEYYGLNEVATDIWELLAEPILVADLCVRLGQRYAVDEARCQREVLALLQQMQDKRMLEYI
jgi:hypothetical protein